MECVNSLLLNILKSLLSILSSTLSYFFPTPHCLSTMNECRIIYMWMKMKKYIRYAPFSTVLWLRNDVLRFLLRSWRFQHEEGQRETRPPTFLQRKKRKYHLKNNKSIIKTIWLIMKNSRWVILRYWSTKNCFGKLPNWFPCGTHCSRARESAIFKYYYDLSLIFSS